MLLFLELAARCCGWPGGAATASPTISSGKFCGLVHCSQDLKPLSFHRGVVEEGGPDEAGGGAAGLRQGSLEAAPGSASTVALFWLPSLLVEGRPLPLSSSATNSSGRRLKALHNLQALMPTRRPSGFGTASSRRSVPSGHVPGDEAVGCASRLHRGGDGAGPDCIFQFRSRVFCANCKDLGVLFYFMRALFVNCTSTADNGR